MSGEIALWAARQDIKNHAAKMVLIALGDAFDDRTGQCFPSLEALGDFVRRSEARIRDAIRWLEEQGWVKRQARFTECGRQTSNGYEIIFERGESFEAMVERRRKTKGKSVKASENGGGDRKRAGEGLENETLKGLESSPPLTESLLNKGAQAREGDKSAFVGKVDWWNRLHLYRKRATWPLAWGPFLNKPGCAVPEHLVTLWNDTKGEAFKNEADNPATKKPAKKSWLKGQNGQNGGEERRYMPGTSHD